MKFILVFICHLLFIATSAQQILKDKYINDLKGAVKECRGLKYGGIVGSDTMEKENTLKLFDKNGRLIEIWSEDISKAGQFGKTAFTYNESGCLQEIRDFFYSGSYKGHSAFECDKNGNIIKETEYYYLYGNVPTKFKQLTYDNNNRLIESFERWGNPKVNNTATPGHEFINEKTEHNYLKYDDKGFLIGKYLKRTGIDDFPEWSEGTLEYKNDSSGKRLFGYRIFKDKPKKVTEELKYNKNGFLCEYISGAYIHFTYEYEYDERGNWTKMVRHGGSFDLTTIRKITYY